MKNVGIIVNETSEFLHIFLYGKEDDVEKKSIIMNILRTTDTRGLLIGDLVEMKEFDEPEKICTEKYQLIDQETLKFRILDAQVGIKNLPEDDVYVEEMFGRIDNSKKRVNFGWYDMIEVQFEPSGKNNIYWRVTTSLRSGTCRPDASKGNVVENMNERFSHFSYLLQEEAKKNQEKEDALYAKLGEFRLIYVDKSDPLRGNMPTLKPVKSTKFGVDSISEGCTIALRDVTQPDDIHAFDLPMGTVFKKGNTISIQLTSDCRNQKFIVGQIFRLESIQIENHLGYWMINGHETNELLIESLHLGEKRDVSSNPKLDVENQKSLSNAKSFIEKDAILNEDQIRAVLNGLDETKNIVLIQGPPGTGKTRTLAELICHFIANGTQIFVATPTKFAKNNIMKAVEKRCAERFSGICDEVTALMDHDKFNELSRIHPLYSRLSSLAKKKDSVIYGSPEFEEAEKEISFIRKKICQEFHQNCRVVFSTITSCYLNFCTRNTRFNPKIMIIDEASQLSETVLWPKTIDIEKIILAGDPQQLPAVVISEKARNHNMGESLMERLYKANKNNMNVCLTIQYRMNNAIMHWSSLAFYDSKLRAHESVENQRIIDLPGIPHNVAQQMKTDVRFNPMVICDTSSEKDVNIYPRYYEKSNEGSFFNEGEAELLVVHLKTLLDHRVPSESIAVITPYNGQKLLLEEMIEERFEKLNLVVDTIDAMQGEEREVILFSLVRNNPLNNCGFLTDMRRLNVAVTRAKRQFFMVANMWMLSSSKDEQFKKLYETFISHGSRISPQIVNNIPGEYPTTVTNMFGPKNKRFLNQCTDETMVRIIENQMSRKVWTNRRAWGSARRYPS